MQQDPRRRLLRKDSPDLPPPPHLHLEDSTGSITGDHSVPRQDTGVTSLHGIKPNSIKVRLGQAQSLDLTLHLHRGEEGELLFTLQPKPPLPSPRQAAAPPAEKGRGAGRRDRRKRLGNCSQERERRRKNEPNFDSTQRYPILNYV
jgi:hypothetical protein